MCLLGILGDHLGHPRCCSWWEQGRRRLRADGGPMCGTPALWRRGLHRCPVRGTILLGQHGQHRWRPADGLSTLGHWLWGCGQEQLAVGVAFSNTSVQCPPKALPPCPAAQPPDEASSTLLWGGLQAARAWVRLVPQRPGQHPAGVFMLLLRAASHPYWVWPGVSCCMA